MTRGIHPTVTIVYISFCQYCRSRQGVPLLAKVIANLRDSDGIVSAKVTPITKPPGPLAPVERAAQTRCGLTRWWR